MMTIITRVTLKEGSEPTWDAAMRERMTAAREQPGWIGGQIMIPLDGPNRRVIIGTWQTRAHWEAWHSDPKFTATRLNRGSVYSYRVDARFDDARGSGERTEVRPCTLTFVR